MLALLAREIESHVPDVRMYLSSIQMYDEQGNTACLLEESWLM